MSMSICYSLTCTLSLHHSHTHTLFLFHSHFPVLRAINLATKNYTNMNNTLCQRAKKIENFQRWHSGAMMALILTKCQPNVNERNCTSNNLILVCIHSWPTVFYCECVFLRMISFAWHFVRSQNLPRGPKKLSNVYFFLLAAAAVFINCWILFPLR